MSAWVKPGVKCVCVVQGDAGPKRNDICTVDEVKSDATGVWLVLSEYGWRHTDTQTTVERRRPLFRVERFRPLITKTQEQDVSMFKSLLNKTPINETA